jgi:signal transduction histidine kinase
MEEELGENGNIVRAADEVREALHVPEHAIAILDPDGNPIAGEWHGFEYTRQIVGAGETSPHFFTLTQQGHAWRLLTRRQTGKSGDFVVFVGAPLDGLERQHRLLLQAIMIATPALVLLSGALCWWVASAALRPVTLLATQAEAITERSTDWHLAPSTTDELGQLAGAFNRLLDRLTASASAQRQFMADASHELRTPVSVIQTTTEVTLERDERHPWEYREALTIINEQSGRLHRMVEDMLALARADASGLQVSKRPLWLDDIAADCARALSVLGAGRQIAIHTDLEPEVPVTGDTALLRQLTTNLLTNGIQYTPPGGSVSVAVSSDRAGNSAILMVSDTGPGIPVSDRERVFGRFVRLDPARSATSGAGLGLSIARWIAEQHGGTLTIRDNPGGGCQFVLQMPLGRPARA